jgi:hypothetical protein
MARRSAPRLLDLLILHGQNAARGRRGADLLLPADLRLIDGTAAMKLTRLDAGRSD